MKRSAYQSGFTLIELLIAMAVFAVMAAIAYGGLSSVISTRDSIDTALDRSKQLQMGLWRLQQDIEQTVDRPVRNRFGDPEPPLMGSADPRSAAIRIAAGIKNGSRKPNATLKCASRLSR